MYKHFPLYDDSLDAAEAWAHDVAQHEQHPDLADLVGHTTRRLMSQAIGRNPAGSRVHIEITVTKTGIKVETHDPGIPDPVCGLELREVSDIASSYGSCSDSTGHHVWAELRTAPKAEAR